MVPAFFLQEDGLMFLGGILHFENKSTDTLFKEKNHQQIKTLRQLYLEYFPSMHSKIFEEMVGKRSKI
jgi:hypothetical protein